MEGGEHRRDADGTGGSRGLFGVVDEEGELDFDVAVHFGVGVDRESADGGQAGEFFEAGQELVELGESAFALDLDGEFFGAAQGRGGHVVDGDVAHAGFIELFIEFLEEGAQVLVGGDESGVVAGFRR